MNIGKLITSVRHFFSVDLWLTHEGERRSLHYVKKFLSILVISVREFLRDGVSNRASALTYSTLLSCIPILAILFAITRGFGVGEALESFLYETFNTQQEVANYLMRFVDSYLNEAHNGLFLGIGIIALLVTVVNLTSNIETAFNDIWEVRTPRTLYRKVTDYFSIFLLLPVFIVVSSGLSIFIGTMVREMHDYIILGSMIKFLIRLSPYLMSWLMFTGLYIFMPNTKVRFLPALISGIVAGTVYQLFQFLYINGQFSLSKYNAIYGSFAALPLLLLWLQISWTIILYGAEVCYAIQNAHNFFYGENSGNLSRKGKDFASILIASMVYKRFYRDEKPLTSKAIAARSQLPIRLVHQTLNSLQHLGLLHAASDEEKHEGDTYYLPSKDVHRLTVGQLLQCVYVEGGEHFGFHPEQIDPALWDALKIESGYADTSDGVAPAEPHFLNRLLIDLPDQAAVEKKS